jgi:perosamine synthetase
MSGNEWGYIKDCLDTNFVSSVGPYVDLFEKQMARQVGTRYAISTVNGTAALHIALLVAGVQPEDEVFVSTLTFIAPINTIRYVGAWPVFIDAEPVYWQMDPEKLNEYIVDHCHWEGGVLTDKKNGRQVKAIIPVHILGHPCDMDPIMEIARKYQLVVIEDATESLGAKYKDRCVGQIGDIACFSFNGNKIITTGGGGMITTDNEAWARRAKYLTTQAKDDPLEFIHGEVGYNYRLSNIQAAVGCAQLEMLPAAIQKKRQIASTYARNFSNLPGIEPMKEASWGQSIMWMFTVLVDKDQYGLSSRELLAKLDEQKIQTRPLWQPAHLSPAHNQANGHPCPVAESLNQRALSLPCSVGLSEEDQERVIATILSLH